MRSVTFNVNGTRGQGRPPLENFRVLRKITQSGLASYHQWKWLGTDDILLLIPATIDLLTWILITATETQLKVGKGKGNCQGKGKVTFWACPTLHPEVIVLDQAPHLRKNTVRGGDSSAVT